MRDHLLVFLNGKPLRLGGEEAFVPLSEFVRRRRRLTGTKVVCAEGDCGACGVLVGRLAGEKIEYAAINSCIQLMFQLDGAHVITIEGLAGSGELNPVQQAMVDCHGAQCGFCTPGFVVSLYDLLRHGQALDAAAVKRGLTGNLCRCTGYDSIIRAALRTDAAAVKPLDALYPPGGMIEAMKEADGEEVDVRWGEKHFYKPVTTEQAVRFSAEHPGRLIVSGATDLGVQCNKGIRTLGVAMSVGRIGELRSVGVVDGGLDVGAAATLMELEQAARKHLPELAEFLEWFGSPLIRNSGTLAGNLVNASPIGDLICALFVLETRVEIAGPGGRREVELERFYTGYRKTVLAGDEIVTAVRIGLPRRDEVYKLYKVSKRKDLDISSVAAGFWMRREGEVIADIRIACGGVGPVVVRLRQAEQALRGRAAGVEAVESAAEAARREVTPITDVRGSAEYRRALAGNLILKFFGELDDNGGGAAEAPRPLEAGRLREAVLRSPERRAP